ncbi:MAG: ParA family protein [Anaerolineae bacterium]|nr:ParA family protein [Anaerolineae bacterium]
MNTNEAKILSICNFKGGVGKSATAHALGAVLAEHGYRVLMVDADPQSSLTSACGVGDAAGASLAEVMGGASPGALAITDIIQELGANFDLAPADLALAASELGLTARLGRENVMKKALAPVAGRYDVILIDCQPSLGLLTVNALVASHGVLCPTQPTAQDLRGLNLFLDSVEQIRAELNRELEVIGCLLTFFDRRLVHHRDALEVIKQVGLPVLGIVPRSVRAAEAASLCQPVTIYAPDNPTSLAYRELAEKVEQWARNAKPVRG